MALFVRHHTRRELCTRDFTPRTETVLFRSTLGEHAFAYRSALLVKPFARRDLQVSFVLPDLFGALSLRFARHVCAA